MWRNGRRARLRGVWSNPWGFKSPHRHHKQKWLYATFVFIMLTVRTGNAFFLVQRIFGRTKSDERRYLTDLYKAQKAKLSEREENPTQVPPLTFYLLDKYAQPTTLKMCARGD